MTVPIRGPLVGEIIGPEATIDVVLALHPLKPERELVCLPAAWSIAEIVAWTEKQKRATRLSYRLDAAIDGAPILRRNWARVRAKPGATVLLRAVPGDNRNFLRSVLMLGVAVAAMVASGGLLAPVLGASFAVGTFGAAALAAGITIAGTLAINALFPIRPPQLASGSKASTTYSIGGGRNEAALYGSVPVALGRHRVSPKLGAKPYTEFFGDEQYLRMLFVWGYGPLPVSDIKIGETPIASFEGVEIETREGYPGDAPLTLFPGQVLQEDLSIELKFVDGYQIRTTAAGIDEISLDVVAPQGIFRIDEESSELKPRNVSVEAGYRIAGSTGAWTTILGGSGFGGGGGFGPAFNLAARSSDALRRSIRRGVARGQYEVRVKRITADSTDDKITDTVVWTALRGFRNDPPIAFSAPLAVTALRIKATSQLNGVIDTLNGIVSSKGKAWNGAAWVADQTSRNPADLFRLVLQHPANKRPPPDSKIDLTGLQAWHAECVAKGYKFDMVRDFRASVWDTLADIAAAGRATPIFRDGKWSVAWDQPNAPVVQHFTPRNSWGFSGKRVYRHLPHGFRVRFVNEQKGWLQDERTVYDDGYDASNATLLEGVEFPGVTHTDLNHKHGRFHIAQARLRPEIFTLSVDFEHLAATRGDRVRATYDVPMWGLVSGRVKAVAGQVVTLDEPVTMAVGKTYAIRFRLADGVSLLRSVVTAAGEQLSITLSGAGAVPVAGDLFMFGEAGLESALLRIRSIAAGEELSAVLTLVDDAAAISTADQGAIPPYNSGIVAPTDPAIVAPFNLSVAERAILVNGARTPSVLFSWQMPSAGVANFEAEFRDDLNENAWRPAGAPPATQKHVEILGLSDGTWSFRSRALFLDGAPSAWAYKLGEVLEGMALVPSVTEQVESDLAEANARIDEQVVVAQQQALAAEGQADAIRRRLARGELESAGEAAKAWLVNYTLRTEMRVTYGALEASIVEERHARVAADEAQASINQLLTVGGRENSSALTSLSASFSTLDGTVNAHAGQLVSLDSRLDSAEGTLGGHTSAIATLQTDVNAAEGTIAAHSSDLVSLDSRLDSAEGVNTSQATAISSLTTRVTNAEGVNTSQATALTALDAEVGDTNAQGLFSIAAAADQTGATVRLAARLRTTVGGTFSESGFYGQIAGGVSKWYFLTDQFGIASTVGGAIIQVFQVSGGNVRMSGNLLVDGTVETGKLAANAVTQIISNYAAGPPGDSGPPNWTVNNAVAVTLTRRAGTKALIFLSTRFSSGDVNGSGDGLDNVGRQVGIYIRRNGTDIKSFLTWVPVIKMTMGSGNLENIWFDGTAHFTFEDTANVSGSTTYSFVGTTVNTENNITVTEVAR